MKYFVAKEYNNSPDREYLATGKLYGWTIWKEIYARRFPEYWEAQRVADDWNASKDPIDPHAFVEVSEIMETVE